MRIGLSVNRRWANLFRRAANGGKGMDTESFTRLLAHARDGNSDAHNRAYALIYDRLRAAAHQQLRKRGGQYTLCTTMLVGEAWLKLADAEVPVRDREHYLALAALAMRHIVVDQARRAMAEKRGGNDIRVTLNENVAQLDAADADVLSLDAALDKLAALDPRLAKIVEWRYFGGMSETEIASMLDVTERTVRREWRKARAFLYREMGGSDNDEEAAT